MILSFETWQITLFSLSVGLASTLLILPFGIATGVAIRAQGMAAQKRVRNDRLAAARHAAGIDGLDPVENLRKAEPRRAVALRPGRGDRL